MIQGMNDYPWGGGGALGTCFVCIIKVLKVFGIPFSYLNCTYG